MSQIYPLIGFFCYFLVCLIALIVMFTRKVARQKKQRIEEMLLRGPGEGLLEKMEHLDEQLLLGFIVALAFPIGLGGILLKGVTYLPGSWQWSGAAFSLIAFLIALVVGLSLLIKKLEEYRNYKLGYKGERFVAEQLDPLRERGYRVFHDVPRRDGSYQSNIDHVVVGRSGVYAIETKTYRKNDRRKRPGAPLNVIIFDGEKVGSDSV